MSTENLKEVAIDQILDSNNLIVPEIQREYVWGFKEHKILNTFLEDLIEGKSNLSGNNSEEIKQITNLINAETTPQISKQALQVALDAMVNEHNDLNIGFLYSYSPNYSAGTRDRDLYLIDGQQRFTTLFLLLFYLALKENRLAEYFSLFRIDVKKGKLGFDYRVRSLTHQFFIELFTNTKTINDLLDISNKTWFLKAYSLDVTIKAIVGDENRKGVFNVFNYYFAEHVAGYYDFVKSKIKFWHFKTEETSQGEELYITMNSRGQQLADNESLRAKLFDDESVRSNSLFWSEKWEVWQDFFWKNRNKNLNHTADEGFNEFLRWVQILEMCLSKEENISRTNIFTVLQTPGIKLDYNFLNLDIIDKYFNALIYLFGTFEHKVLNEISKKYGLSDISKFFNKKKFIGRDEPLDQRSLFRLIPVLHYCARHIIAKVDLDDHQLFRFAKFAHNVSLDENVRKSIREQVINIVKLADKFELNGSMLSLYKYEEEFKTIFNLEQSIKSISLSESSDIILSEDYFWFAEKLGYNEGEIAHLISLTNTVSGLDRFSLDHFKTIVSLYEEFFENEETIWGNLINSDVYTSYGDRVLFVEKYNFSKGLLGYLFNRYQSGDILLDEFILNLQKAFILNYTSFEEFASEADPKKQLYIFYIIQSNEISKKVGKWYWSGRYNFGIWSNGYPGHNNMFSNRNVYQLINRKFTENSSNILDIHKKKVQIEPLYADLINWAKN